MLKDKLNLKGTSPLDIFVSIPKNKAEQIVQEALKAGHEVSVILMKSQEVLGRLKAAENAGELIEIAKAKVNDDTVITAVVEVIDQHGLDDVTATYLAVECQRSLVSSNIQWLNQQIQYKNNELMTKEQEFQRIKAAFTSTKIIIP